MSGGREAVHAAGSGGQAHVMTLGEKVGRHVNFGEMTPQRKDLNTLATAAGSGIMASTKAIYSQRVEGGGEGGGAAGGHLTEQGAHRANT